MDLQFLRVGLTVEPSVGATMVARARIEKREWQKEEEGMGRKNNTVIWCWVQLLLPKKKKKIGSDGKYLLFSVSGADLRKQRSCN